ncbi:MAG: hypothetical protein ABIZ04_15455 [Opitutus sp.]
MKLRLRDAVFVVGMGLLAATLVAESVGIVAAVRGRRVVHRQVLALKKELRTLGKVQPALTEENSSTIAADLANATNALARLRVELTSTGESADVFRLAPRPTSKADGYFDIAAFVERMREQAALRGVRLRPDERFGFAAYEHNGPEADVLSTVFCERYATEYLLGALFDVRPYALIGVQRERAVGDPKTVAGRETTESGSLADTFEWDRQLSSRTSAVDCSALRISFVGETVTLRTLLNRLARFELPLVVRAVEIEPVATERGKAAAPTESDLRAPLVAKSLSRFAVTIEVIHLLDSAGREL